MQDRLLYYPQPLLGSPPTPPVGRTLETVQWLSKDNHRLHGWLIRPATTNAPLVIYFGGNAEEVSWQITQAHRYQQYALLLVNYRGYGRSEGTPSEQALFADALTIYDEIGKRADIDHSRIVLHGRSLGSGVAVHLASQRAVQGLILTTPYDSIEALAQSHFPAWMVALFLRERYDSLALADRLTVPLLCLIAPQDQIVPNHHSQRLFDAWVGKKKWWSAITGTDHNSISERSAYWDRIGEFLDDLQA